MQQFRSLPRFDLPEEAEPVEIPLASTTDPIPVLTDPQPSVPISSPLAKIRLQPTGTSSQFIRMQVQPTDTRPQFAAFHPQPTATDPLLPVTGPQPVALDPLLPVTGPQPTKAAQQAVAAQATGRIPLVLLNGSSVTSTTDQLTALMGKSQATGKYPTLTAALQATMSTKVATTGETSRLVVIPGAGVRKKVSKTSPRRRLNMRVRQGVVFIATLIIVICTLTTLVPLSDDQSGGNLFSNIGGWIHSAQLDWDIQAHQGDQNAMPTALNGPGLPYMAIANSPYVAVAEQAAANAGIPPAYFVRQIQQESGFNASAVSITDAEGIAQFEPYTASGLGINPWDPNSALPGAARLMANYYHQYGNYAKALGAYNAGPGAVQGAVYSCGMYWLSCMPGQSQDYVYRIMGV